ncbi:MAG: ion transporter [Rhizomicrobium sp.]
MTLAEDYHLTTPRHNAYVILEGGRTGGFIGHIVEGILITLIVGNVLAYILQSIPSIDKQFANLFSILEAVSVAIFTLEYLVRLWTAPEDPTTQRGRFRSRIGFVLRPMMVIDFLSIAPAYVALFIPFVDLRFLRLIRLLRLLKIARYSPALSTLAQVLAEERRALYGTVCCCCARWCLPPPPCMWSKAAIQRECCVQDDAGFDVLGDHDADDGRLRRRHADIRLGPLHFRHHHDRWPRPFRPAGRHRGHRLRELDPSP